MRILALMIAAMMLVACDKPPDYTVVGTLERDRIVLSAERREPITAIHIREGDRVEAGEILLELESQRAEAELQRLLAQRQRRQRRLDELVRGPRHEVVDEARARLAAAEAALDNTERELARTEQLHADKLSSEHDVDNARSARDVALGERDAARASLEAMLAGTTVEELDQARAALAAIEASLMIQRRNIERLTLTSPRAGIVESLPFELGETPAPGTALVILRAVDAPPYARVYVPAGLRERLPPAANVRVHIAGDEYTGTVRFISSEAAFTPYFALTEHDADRLSYVAEIDIANGEHLPTGIPVRAVLPGDEP